ncbi:MAG: DNA repair protein RadA [Burkholderiales bacterium]|nr:DNA repair protein RadA [Burkholderiales bacterium]
MAKARSEFVCRECATVAAKWQGQCAGCGAWNTLDEVLVESTRRRTSVGVAPNSSVARLADVKPEALLRWSTGLLEFDRALGGGLVPGGVTLIGGDPGIGKSTLTLQAIAALATTHGTLYVSGEESAAQVASRAARLGLDLERIVMLAETSLEAIIGHIEALRPRVVVIDSIQTLFSAAFSSAPGSVVQVRECAAELTRLAKRQGVAMLLVGHVTKEGAIAGPRVLEHLVDTVIYFEGEPGSNLRIIRALKNRFGGANEIGVFAMLEDGLREVGNPSAIFLARGGEPTPGNAVFASIEGSRPLLVQVQALVDRTAGNPRRVCTGFDSQRLAMLLAVMNRHLGCQLGGYDVFINVVGGLRIDEPAADLAIVLAIWSSLSGVVIPIDTAIFGEIGLGGEVRPVVGSAQRVGEAVKLGFTRVIGPVVNRQARALADQQALVSVDKVAAAVQAVSPRANS